MKNKEIYSIFALFIVVLFWGFGFIGLAFVSRIPTFIINAIRFIGSSLILMMVFPKKAKKIDKSYLKFGIPAGFIMFLVYICATVGIRYTTASRTAFFSCLSAVCVPIIVLALFRKIPSKKSLLGLGLCVVGVYLISMGGSTDFGFNKGDLICLLCSFFTACELVWIEKTVGDQDPVAFTIVELGIVGLLSLLFVPVMGERLPQDITALEIGSMIFLCLCCTALAFILKTFAQKNIPANRTSLILTMEPVVGGIASALILKENMGFLGYIGAVIVVLAIIISEYQPEAKQ